MNWFNLSLVGWLIVIAALVLAALQFEELNRVWIAIGALALLGIGVITSVRHSKPKI